jgi:hypothetical protein
VAREELYSMAKKTLLSEDLSPDEKRYSLQKYQNPLNQYKIRLLKIMSEGHKHAE